MKIDLYRVGRFVDQYITECQECHVDDRRTIETLLEFFSDDELEAMGFGDYIKEYMED